VWPPVRQVPDDLLGKAPPLGDPPDELAELGVHQAAHRLAVGLGELRLGVQVLGVLVLVAVVHLRHHAELVERPLEERVLVDDPGQPDVAGRLEPDLVERGRQVVAAVAGTHLAERLRVGDGELPRLAEGPDGVPQILGHRKAMAAGAHLGDEARDPVIGGGALEGLDVAQHRRRFAQHERGKRVIGDSLDELGLQVDLEDRGRRHAGLHEHARDPEHDESAHHQQRHAADQAEKDDQKFLHADLFACGAEWTR